MTQVSEQYITSRDNPFFKELRKLSKDNLAYRKYKKFWVEGEHLCLAAIYRKVKPILGVFSESGWLKASHSFRDFALNNFVIPDVLFNEISSLESPSNMGFIFPLNPQPLLEDFTNTVILDGVQDAGNVGAILRSASAFGFKQVVALKGSAALWSVKVLRAGMGAHFGLSLLESVVTYELKDLKMPILVTSSHSNLQLEEAVSDNLLPSTCAWVFGNEGKGVSKELFNLSALQLAIAQPGGEESLNVTAAAAICMYTSSLNSLRKKLI